MTWGAVAVAGGTALLGFTGQQQAAEAQREANTANERLSLTGLNEQRRQFEAQTGQLSESRRQREDEINRELQGRFDALRGENIGRLDPFAQAGTAALSEQQALLGLSGAEAGQQALSRFTESPGQQFLRERQERALLRNQAAIGGLGGGNVRTGLQEQAFGRAQTDLSNRQALLGGIARQGLSAAGQQGAGQGFGPGRVSTGADVGVREGPAAGDIPTTSGGGGNAQGLLGTVANLPGQILGGLF